MNKNLFTKVFYIFNTIVLFFVIAWQWTRHIRSYLNLSSCRFYPSCSDYFCEAIKKQGLFFGLVLSLKRLFKCHPLSEGGIDKVPINYGH